MAKKPAKIYTWKDPTGLTRAVLVVMALSLAANFALIAVWLMFGEAALYDAASDEAFTTAQFISWSVDMVALVILLACAVIPFWIVRVSRNAHVLRPQMKFSPLGSIGWYLVPIASLFKPFQALSEIWLVSSTKADRGSDKLLAAWWVSLIMGGLASTFGGKIGDAAGAWIAFAANLLGIAVAILFMIIVRRLSSMQIEKHQTWVDAGSPSAPALSALQLATRPDW